MILAFDTATAATVVGLLGEDGTVAEARHDPEPGERPQHAQVLLPLVQRLLASAGGWAAVTRVGVGVGPGSFTGLRIGIATARSLAMARGVELAPVSTLAALATGAERNATVLAVLDARRGEAFAAAWRGLEQLRAPAALTPDALRDAAASLHAPVLAAGDGAVRFRESLEAAGAEVPADASPLHRVHAAPLCRLAAQAAAAPAGTVLPDYLRLPDAELARRKRTASA